MFRFLEMMEGNNGYNDICRIHGEKYAISVVEMCGEVGRPGDAVTRLSSPNNYIDVIRYFVTCFGKAYNFRSF